MRRTNLFELLGRPVERTASDLGTSETRTPETYEDAGVLPSIEDCGTTVTRADWETYDDDSLLPLM